MLRRLFFMSALLILPAAVLAQAPDGAAPAPSVAATPAVIPSPVGTRTPVPSPAPTAAAEQTLAGSWDMRIEGTTIFRFDIARTTAGQWQGRWSRPETFNSDGNNFGNLGGGVKTTASMTGNAIVDVVELAFDDPRPGAVPDIFRFRQLSVTEAEMTYVGTQLAPYRLVRAAPGDALGNWPQGRVFRRQTAAPRTAGSAPAADAPPGPIILGPQVRFLDLRPRPAAPASAEAGSAAPAASSAAGQQGAASAPASPVALVPAPQVPALPAQTPPAQTPTAQTPTSSPSAAPVPVQPPASAPPASASPAAQTGAPLRISADFLDIE